jgi:hypothetical protein
VLSLKTKVKARVKISAGVSSKASGRERLDTLISNVMVIVMIPCKDWLLNRPKQKS